MGKKLGNDPFAWIGGNETVEQVGHLNESVQVSKKANKTPGRPKRKDLVRDNAAQKGLPTDYTRKTVIINIELLKKLEDYAYTERLSLKDALEELLEDSLKDKVLIKKKRNKK